MAADTHPIAATKAVDRWLDAAASEQLTKLRAALLRGGGGGKAVCRIAAVPAAAQQREEARIIGRRPAAAADKYGMTTISTSSRVKLSTNRFCCDNN